MRRIVLVLSISALLFIVGCGGSSHSSRTSNTGGNTIVTSGNNVAPVIVDAGPPSVASSDPDLNLAFTTVVVCAPNSTNCVTIDHVTVDTGSTGLRIPAEVFPTYANGANVLAALQNVNPTTPTAECYNFTYTFNWGTVRFADVKMGGSSNTGEVASSVPIQITGDPSVPTIPSDCAGAEMDTVATLGSNGLLGVNYLQYDCDSLGFQNFCVSSGTMPAATYYTCSGSSCSISAVPLTQQVRNPVSLFADNNGVILELPSVPADGETGISEGQASLVFGIGTQSNNGLGSAVVLTIDSNPSDDAYTGFTTVYNGHSYPSTSDVGGSFLDSGSNSIDFLDQAITGIPDCSFNVGFYCPTSTQNLSATNQATGGNSTAVQFSVVDADTLPSGFAAFSGLAGPNSVGTVAEPSDGFFDWGLPFFYGRNVYTAIWNVTPPGGVPAGPFWAY